MEARFYLLISKLSFSSSAGDTQPFIKISSQNGLFQNCLSERWKKQEKLDFSFHENPHLATGRVL